MQGEPDMRGMPAEMQRTFATLRVKFTEDVDSRILFFEAALAELRDGTDPAAAARSIRDGAHGVSGVASSLGFAEVGTAARQAEQMWDSVAAGTWDQAELDAAIAALDNLLDRLEATLDL